eukprot:COSAG05_NODE_2914_length_2512_cov_10.137588_2_plen_139_part_00
MGLLLSAKSSRILVQEDCGGARRLVSSGGPDGQFTPVAYHARLDEVDTFHVGQRLAAEVDVLHGRHTIVRNVAHFEARTYDLHPEAVDAHDLKSIHLLDHLREQALGAFGLEVGRHRAGRTRSPVNSGWLSLGGRPQY